MMNMIKIGFFILVLSLVACSPIKNLPVNQYTLTAYCPKHVLGVNSDSTLYVSPPEASAPYQTSHMLYVKKPYTLRPFAKNAWISAPADMLYPLIVQSLQQTHFFHAITSGYYPQKANYRLDTQLLALQQDFTTKPSLLIVTLRAVVTHVKDSRPLASRVFTLRIPCLQDNPYGGVVAANQATRKLTALLTKFVIDSIR